MTIKTKKLIVLGIVVYLLFGFIHGMIGEMRLAKKYQGNPYLAWKDPYAYATAIAFSPFWPNNLFWTVYHCGNLFGCPIPKN